MDKLNENWITEHNIDFEYKKYVLLAYLQHVSESFEQVRLYPSFGELVQHYRNVVALREYKQQLFDSFPGKLSGADLNNFKLVYERLCEDDQLMKEIESIIAFSIPRFKAAIEDGKKIYEFIESNSSLFPVGIMPLHKAAGYLFLKSGERSETRVYEYQLSIIEAPDEKYRSIALQYRMSFEQTISNTYENIKQELVRFNRSLPNPATWVVETNLVVPIEDTLLPLAKRSLMRVLATA